MTKVLSTSLNRHQPDLKIKSDSAQKIVLLEKLQSFDLALHGDEALIDVPVGRELFHLPKSPSI